MKLGFFTSTLHRMQLADYKVSIITNTNQYWFWYDIDTHHLSSSVLHDEGLVLSLILFHLLFHLLHINAIGKVEDCIRHWKNTTILTDHLNLFKIWGPYSSFQVVCHWKICSFTLPYCLLDNLANKETPAPQLRLAFQGLQGNISSENSIYSWC